MITASAIYTCDRDGVVSDVVQGQPNQSVQMPEGWVQITRYSIGAPGVMSVAGHLCPGCASAFGEFVGKEGAFAAKT